MSSSTSILALGCVVDPIYRREVEEDALEAVLTLHDLVLILLRALDRVDDYRAVVRGG